MSKGHGFAAIWGATRNGLSAADKATLKKTNKSRTSKKKPFFESPMYDNMAHRAETQYLKSSCSAETIGDILRYYHGEFRKEYAAFGRPLYDWQRKTDELERLICDVNDATGEGDPPAERLEALLQPQDQGDIVRLEGDDDICGIGDPHGDLTSQREAVSGILDPYTFCGSEHLPYIVFTGDYVNNGLRSVETLIYLLELKKRHPKKVILLSGNHEFRETYLTCYKEFFHTHWDDALRSGFVAKQPPRNHYNHVRFELVRTFGATRGEKLYDHFEEWGWSLPFLAYHKERGILISHSFPPPEKKGELSELLSTGSGSPRAKSKADLGDMGYETWKKSMSLHAQTLNNREGLRQLSDMCTDLELSWWVVGHTHFRSGDIVRQGRTGIVTVCSSRQDSPDAGHYMHQELHVVRGGKKDVPRGDALPCYVRTAHLEEGEGEKEPPQDDAKLVPLTG